MRKILCCMAASLSLLLLCACDVGQMSSLTAFAKPYTGIYTCEKLTLGGENVLDKFDRVDLELKYSGAFVLSYRTAEGGEGEIEGEYTLDEETGELIFSKKTPLRTVEHRFTYRKGVIFADFNYQGNLLHAEFSMP